MKNIKEVASSSKLLKVPFIESLFNFGICGRKSREMRLRDKISQSFDDTLDIRSFVSVQTNLGILLNLLFTKEQMLLFKLNKSHSIATSRQIKMSLNEEINNNGVRQNMDESCHPDFKFDLS